MAEGWLRDSGAIILMDTSSNSQVSWHLLISVSCVTFAYLIKMFQSRNKWKK